MSFAVGSLVTARGREWVVLPDSSEELLVLRPLGGTNDEVTGIYLPLEPDVVSATFDLPPLEHLGDYRSCRLLRDAVRLGFRSSAGPFRSFAQIAVDPRPYQLVPLLMALKLDPVRILIADDVGIGKTIEACLIARELLDRGEVNQLTVLCPPHLVGQWQSELLEKFHIDAELVLPSTASRLERVCGLRSIFEVYPFTVVSTDFIKADQRRDDFLRACPDLVIVDEAHTCASGGTTRSGRHQRHHLLQGLSQKVDRNLILITATPHSGKEDAFRSLLGLLDSSFENLPEDLAGPQNQRQRQQLAAHFVQRRRGDIRRFMDADTPFPEREEKEETYRLSPEYKQLFDRALNYARETVRDPGDNRHHMRVRWWSALALLRSIASSPAAAAATLRSRASTADTDTIEEADEVGRRMVLDLEEEDAAARIDVAPGSDAGEEDEDSKRNRRRLLEMARAADDLKGDKDEKLKGAVKLVKDFIKDGYRPIVFCRFIPTAEYLAQELRSRLPKNVEVAAITGTLPPAEREERVLQLSRADSKKYVLVCTDCLSEGINLQEHFDAVMHYDLSWNPTRHEQREGRADRFGQSKPLVRVLTYYGLDNGIDGIVLDVLVRKHKTIRSSLGISVPVPGNTNDLVEAIFEGLLLREDSGSVDQYLPGFEEYFRPQKEEFHNDWDASAEREKRSRTMFAQGSIKAEEVAPELDAIRSAIGSGVEVERYVREVVQAHGGIVKGDELVEIQLNEAPRSLRDFLGNSDSFKARFQLPIRDDEAHLSRTHPFVENLAAYTMNTALDPQLESVAHRAGVIRTRAVTRRTTLLLIRNRFHIITKRGKDPQPLLAEDCQLLAFEGAPENANWLSVEEAEELLQASPDENVPPDIARHQLERILDGFDHLRGHLDEAAIQQANDLLEAHMRVRQAARARGAQPEVEAKLPPDVLGVYLYLPVTN
jgi:superfamily II DNA or RNA helicase